jgi:endo-1,4-beta-xylanase
VVSWDVVNEPVTDEGSELRDSHWSRMLGADGYMVRAFHKARAADPDAVLFLNDYNLENTPRKGATFLKLVERLMKAGAPIGGIGTQSHLDIRIPAGQIRAFFRDAASLGLPIHVSELDASLRSEDRVDLRSRSQRIERPCPADRPRRRTGRGLHGPARAPALTPSPSGARATPTAGCVRAKRDDGQDQPLLFDGAGRPNPAYAAVAGAFA